MPYLRDVFLTIAFQFEPTTATTSTTTYPTATSLMRLLHLLVLLAIYWFLLFGQSLLIVN